MNKLSILTKGIIKENPVLVLLLGMLSDSGNDYRSDQRTGHGRFHTGGTGVLQYRNFLIEEYYSG